MKITFTFGCLAASNWLSGHPRSYHHVSNLPAIQAGREDPQCSSEHINISQYEAEVYFLPHFIYLTKNLLSYHLIIPNAVTNTVVT